MAALSHKSSGTGEGSAPQRGAPDPGAAVSAVGRSCLRSAGGTCSHKRCFTNTAETRVEEAGDKQTTRSTGLSPWPGCLSPSPDGRILTASSPRPIIHTLTVNLCLQLAVRDFPLLFLPKPQPHHELPTALRGLSRPRQSGEAPRHGQEWHSSPGSGAHCRGIPEHHSRSLRGDQAAPPAPPCPAAPKAAAKGGEDCTSQNLSAELSLLVLLFTSLGSVALQGKVHPHWEYFASEAIYSLRGR